MGMRWSLTAAMVALAVAAGCTASPRSGPLTQPTGGGRVRHSTSGPSSGTSSAGAAVVGHTTPASRPPTPSAAHVPCINANTAPSGGATAGKVKAGPLGDMLAQQAGGGAKFWVQQDPYVGPADAVIRVEIPGPNTTAYYLRPWEERATPQPANGSASPSGPVGFYPGAIMLPREGQKVRITVTIGPESGCFILTT